jgi:hypothetical protein
MAAAKKTQARKPNPKKHTTSRTAAAAFKPDIAYSPGYTGPETKATFGAYNEGTTMDQIARNSWLNSLSEGDKQTAIDKMGYWTGGVGSARKPAGGKRLSGGHDKVLGGVTNESVASSAKTDATVAGSYAEADLTRTGTSAAQGKAYEAMFGTDAGTVLHADAVPSIAQNAGEAAAAGGTTKKKPKKKPGKKPSKGKLKKRASKK